MKVFNTFCNIDCYNTMKKIGGVFTMKKPKLVSLSEKNDKVDNKDNCLSGKGKSGNACSRGTGRLKPPNSCMDGGNSTSDCEYSNACGQGG